jgi:predicted ArsR family transcriptional regulator
MYRAKRSAKPKRGNAFRLMITETHQGTWTFVTNHTQVLLCIARDPDIRLRDVAASVGITERAAQRILGDLVDAGYVTRTRIGRRNRYKVNGGLRMRHPAQATYQVRELLEVLTDAAGADDRPALTG